MTGTCVSSIGGCLGRDWIPRDSGGEKNNLPTIAFFGAKGGVGRSTALSVVARRLAEKGERVMVLDLDLESPGVSSLLLPLEARTRFGVVDWLVESGVGQADGDLLLAMSDEPIGRPDARPDPGDTGGRRSDRHLRGQAGAGSDVIRFPIGLFRIPRGPAQRDSTRRSTALRLGL